MAEIPIEQKSGSKSWLWILLALLLVALLAWWLLSDDREEGVEPVVSEAVTEAPVLPAAGTLVIGEMVDMDGVEVTSLAGDMAFYVDHQGQRVPVFFDEVRTPGSPTEGRLDINPGTMVNIDGEVRAANDRLPEGADPSILGDSQNYIFANDIEIVG